MSLSDRIGNADLAPMDDRRGAEAFDAFPGRWARPVASMPVPDPLMAVPVDHGYVFSARSWRSLHGIDTRLIAAATEALTRSPIDFIVIEGLRTKERQRALFSDGKSRTMNSRHLTGHAFDVAAFVDGAVSWEAEHYAALSVHFLAAAERLGVQLEWGGNFRGFFDGPHFQIPWRA